MAWLKAVGESLVLNTEDRDAIVVLHLGADSVDCVVLPLQRRGDFIVPVRDPKYFVESTSGGLEGDEGGSGRPFGKFQLVEQVLFRACEEAGINPTLSALWNAMLNVDLLRVHNSDRKASGIWYVGDDCAGDKWARYPQSLSDPTSLGSMPMGSPTRISDFVLGLEGDSGVASQDLWRDFMASKLQAVVGKASGLNVRGAVLSGFGEGPGKESWRELFEPILSAGMAEAEEPAVDFFWMPAGTLDVATGCRIYGERIENGEPTYLDTLPVFETLVLKDEVPDWISMLPQRYVDGGESVEHEIPFGRLLLQANKKKLVVSLRIGSRSEEDLSTRVAHVSFPSETSEDMPIRAEIKMRPAGGRPTVEFIPQDREFLERTRIFLDFERMSEEVLENRLPYPKVEVPPGQQPQEPHEVAVDDWALTNDWSHVIHQYLGSTCGEGNWQESVKDVRQRVSQSSARQDLGTARPPRARPVGVNGEAPTPEGRQVVRQLIDRMESDIEEMRVSALPPTRRKPALSSLVTAVTWFYCAVSEELTGYIFQELEKCGDGKPTEISAQNLTYASARTAYTAELARVFFVAMRKKADQRVRKDPSKRYFANQWNTGARTILTHYAEAAGGLTGDLVDSFFFRIPGDLDSWSSEFNEGKGHVGCAQLMLLTIYLLRYRITEPDYMGPSEDHHGDESQGSDSKRQRLFDAIELVERRIDARGDDAHYAQQQAFDRLREACGWLRDWLNKRGNPEVLRYLEEMFVEAGGDDRP